MFCAKCGEKMIKGAQFCGKCGTSLQDMKQVTTVANETVQENTYKDTVYEETIYNEEFNANNYASEEVFDEDDRRTKALKKATYVSSTLAKGFVEEDERALFSLNRGILANVVLEGIWSSSDVVLTGKRMYYSVHFGFFNRRDKEMVVDLEDISATSIDNKKPSWALFLSIILIIAGLGYGMSTGETTAAYVGVIAGFGLGIFYLLSRVTVLTIAFAGGQAYIPVKNVSLDRIRSFQRSIYAIRESLRD